jgi:hypothetical protein
LQVNVFRPEAPHDIEEGDKPSVPLVVHSISKEYRRLDDKTGLLLNFPEQRLLNGLALLDSTPETCPTVRVGDFGLVVAMMHEQSTVCHDKQHRRPALRLRSGL